MRLPCLSRLWRYMKSLFDDEQVMKSFIRSEPYEAAQFHDILHSAVAAFKIVRLTLPPYYGKITVSKL